MRLPAACLLFPLLAAAQTTPPSPEVEQALRERATQFLQYQVEGNFRKSFDLVAEDTKDWYFGTAKGKLNSFKIETIEYAENFTKAMVKGTTKRTIAAMGQSFVIDVALLDRWKVEDGKWVWYRDPTVMETPFGAIPVPTGPEATAPGQSGLPTDTSPAAVAAAASKLPVAATSVDKSAITFTEGVPGTEEIVFHSGAPGRLKVNKMIAMDSISVDVTNVTLKPDQDVRVKVTYTPDTSGLKRTTIRLTVEPFARAYNIAVTLRPK